MTPLRSPEGIRSDLEDTCHEAFWTSLLLTGNVEQAESVVIDAIELWSPGDTVEGALTRYVIDRSVQAREPVDIRPASEILSEELRPVLKLAGARRHCFVLRVLANLSRHACACILGLTSLQVDRYTSAALANLGELREQDYGGVATAWAQLTIKSSMVDPDRQLFLECIYCPTRDHQFPNIRAKKSFL